MNFKEILDRWQKTFLRLRARGPAYPPLNEKQKLLLALLGFALFIFFFDKFLLLPRVTSYLQTKRDFANLQAKLLTLPQDITRLTQLEKKLEILEQKKQKFSQDMETGAGQVKFYQTIVESARRAGFSLSNLEQTKDASETEENSPGALPHASLHLSASSTYSDLLHFLTEVENGTSIFTLNNLKLELSEGGHLVNVQLTLSRYGY